MPTIAAIDIGSNSCRLKIAKIVAHQLRTVHEDREVTRLGGSVFECGLVSPEAMAATLRALKRFQRAVQTHGVDQIRVVATSAMRDARNAPAFQAWVKAEPGHRPGGMRPASPICCPAALGCMTSFRKPNCGRQASPLPNASVPTISDRKS